MRFSLMTWHPPPQSGARFRQPDPDADGGTAQGEPFAVNRIGVIRSTGVTVLANQ